MPAPRLIGTCFAVDSLNRTTVVEGQVGNAVVPSDDPFIGPPQAFVDAMAQFDFSGFAPTLNFANLGIETFRPNSAFFHNGTNGCLLAMFVNSGGSENGIDLSGNKLDQDSVDAVVAKCLDITTNYYPPEFFPSNTWILKLEGGTNAAPTPGATLTAVEAIWTVTKN